MVAVDADLQASDPSHPGRGNDRFAELFPTGNLNIAWLVSLMHWGSRRATSIVDDGADGGAAVVRVEGQAPHAVAAQAALATVQAPDFWLATDFVLEPGASWVTLSTTYSFVTGPADPVGPVEPVDYFDDGMPLLDWAIEQGLVAGDFYLSGGSADVFAPGIGFDEDGAVYEKMSTGGNTLTEPFQFPFLASVGEGVSYGIAPAEGDLYVPLFTSSQTVAVGGGKEGNGSNERFDAGSAFVYDRYFFVGHGDVGSVLDGYLRARDPDRNGSRRRHRRAREQRSPVWMCLSMSPAQRLRSLGGVGRAPARCRRWFLFGRCLWASGNWPFTRWAGRPHAVSACVSDKGPSSLYTSRRRGPGSCPS